MNLTNYVLRRLMVIRYWIRWGILYTWYNKKKWKFILRAIDDRLMRKGFSWDKSSDITHRYLRMLQYKSSVETKKKTRLLYDAIVKASERTGIPQWEIRASIEKSFGIKV